MEKRKRVRGTWEAATWISPRSTPGSQTAKFRRLVSVAYTRLANFSIYSLNSLAEIHFSRDTIGSVASMTPFDFSLSKPDREDFQLRFSFFFFEMDKDLRSEETNGIELADLYYCLDVDR